MAGQCAGITKRDRPDCDCLYRTGSQTVDRGPQPAGIAPRPQVGTAFPPKRNFIVTPRFATYKVGR